MDIEKSKKKRTLVRQLFSKLVTKIEGTFNEPLSENYTKEQKLEDLHDQRNQFIDKISKLKELDNDIEQNIDIDDLETEYFASEEYQERGIKWKTKLDRYLGNFPTVVAQNVLPVNVPSETQNIVRNETHRNNENVVKLPKLNIVKFFGDCSSWLDFWNSYEVAIHNNDSLNKVQKFTYLKTYLGGIALTAVSGFSLTNENYDSSIQLLKARFGRLDLIISSHINRLLLIEPVRNCSNVVALRKMYDVIEVQIRSLQSLNVATGTYSNLLCPVILQKIPEELNLNYNRNRETNELFDIQHLIEFLRKEVECREASSLLANPRNVSGNESTFRNRTMYQGNQNKHYIGPKRDYPTTNIPTAAALIATVNENCIFCSDKSHITEKCPLPLDERKNSLKTYGRCFICLKRRHIAKLCWKKDQTCKICKKSHNYLICDQAPHVIKTKTIESNRNDPETVLSAISSFRCFENKKERKQPSPSILLQTFSAVIKTKKKRVVFRVLLDGGSNQTFIKKQIADSLGLKVIRREAFKIHAFGGRESNKVYDIVEFDLQNRTNPALKVKIQAVVIESITQGTIEIPSQLVRKLAFEKGIELADIGTTMDIHILIGSNYIWEILCDKNVRLSKYLVATDSVYGFVIQGREIENTRKEVYVNHVAVIGEASEHEMVKCLWELEAIGINQDGEFSHSDTDVINKFEQNTVYKNNRYETKLLWKENYKELNSNYKVAERRLVSLNNKFWHDPDLYFRYKEIIEEQLKEGIIEQVEFPSDHDNHKGYFMPHHAVVRELKESTKVRIVYDASSKTRDEQSLNDCLESGPNLNPDLLKIILKFRYHRIAFCADIQRAFLEVGIIEEDRKFLQFLWGNKKEADLGFGGRDIGILQFKRVPFGVKCSPFLLTATIRLHLKKYEKSHSEACAVLKELYVDDLISGTATIEEAISISRDASYILSEASMNLRRWTSNSGILTELWNVNKMEHRQHVQEPNIPLKVLGLIWDNVKDTLKIELNQYTKMKDVIPTKRLVLGACGMLFDPIGLITPFTVRIKLMMQTLWQKGIQWDESLPTQLQLMFKDWINEIVELKNLVIPRPYFDELQIKRLELHIFSDASPKAYGSVAYFKIAYQDKYATSLIISKSRLAPLKKMTLPRLELLGALISARLTSYLKSTFTALRDDDIYLWTDSQICLHWIKGVADEWKPFVRNRVVEIKEKTNPLNWNFCNGKTNPSDRLTRGVSARSLINDELWWTGPPWLLELDMQETVPIFNIDIQEIETERRGNNVTLQMCIEPVEPLLNINNHSDLSKVLRITAYIARFVNNCNPNSEKIIGTLTAKELLNAELYWVRFTQRSEFEKEYIQLKTNTPIKSYSRLYSLNPSLTADGLICLGGRLQQSDFEFQEKHPWIIPGKSKFTELLIMKEHHNLLHSGVSDTLTQIRERYWIIRGRQVVKSCLNNCFICKKFKARPGKQIVAPLPADRINEAKPFEITGIDFAGPLYTKNSDKVYIALFTCAVTRAIHLEVVSSLSTEHFLLAFRRFVSRRGVCRTVNSDNAKTFKAADLELKRLYSNISDPSVQNYFGKSGISWRFIVERAAWWGGYWERMVKMTKILLRKVLGRALVSFEELQTILTEIESILNSRPLTYVYNEPSEPFPLTPAHFLTGKRLTSIPHQVGLGKEKILSNKRVLIKRYMYRERLLNQFWKRWKREYLLQLKGSNCVKPINVICEFNVNDIVLIGEENTPRLLWKMARVVEIHKGRDGKVRSVTLKTSSGTIKRPIQLLYHLELPRVD